MKKFIIIACSIILALIMSMAIFAAVSATVNDDTANQSIKVDNNVVYIPGYTDLTKVVFNIDATKVTVGSESKDYTNGDPVDITAGKKTNTDGTVYYTVKFGTKSGNITVKVYVLADIPCIYLNTSKGIQKLNWNKDERDTNTKISIVDENGNVVYDDVSSETFSELKGRGNMSWTYAKKPYQFKLSSKVDLFGLGKAKTWILLANYVDSSFIRNSLTFKVADALGIKYNISDKYVNVFIDGKFNGLYELTEKVQIGKNRVDINDLEEKTEKLNEGVDLSTLPVIKVSSGSFINNSNLEYYTYCEGIKNPDNITGGYLIELDNLWNSGDACKFKTDNGNTYVMKSPEYASKEQMEYIAKYVSDMEDALYSSDGYNSLGKHYSDYCDVDSLLKVYVVNEITKNWDSYVGSTFFYKDIDKDGEESKLFAGPVWDYDNAYANLDRTVVNDKGETLDFGNDPTCLWATGATGKSYNSYFGRALTSHKELWNKLCELFSVAIKASDDLVNEGGYIDQITTQFMDSALADRVLWNGGRSSAFKQYKIYSDGSNNSAIGAIKEFIIARDKAMGEYFKSEGGEPDSSTTVTVATTTIEQTTIETTVESTTITESSTIATTILENTDAGNKPSSGCKSYIGVSFILPIIAICCLTLKKKNDGEKNG